MLAIRVEEDDREICIALAGGVGEMDSSELLHAWEAVAQRRGQRQVRIDLHAVTHSDKTGARALSNIYAQTNARLMVGYGTPEAEILALEVMYGQEDGPLFHEREWMAMEMD
jgi:ABC-type transporter Mla MlaB component